MFRHSYAIDSPTEAAELQKTILSATSPPAMASVCTVVEHFLQTHKPDQARWFFTITFPTLIRKIFGFEDCFPYTKPQSINGWIDTAILYGGSELSGLFYSQLFMFYRTDLFFIA